MKLSDAKLYLPFVQAAAEGRVIQYNNFQNGTGTWHDITTACSFDSEPTGYRIKPTPKLRPWKPEEVPVGAMLKDDNGFVGYIVCSCLASPTDKGDGWNFVLVGKEAISSYRISSQSFKSWYTGDMVTYIYNLKFSIDHGKTWLPCGVMEE